MCFSLTLSLWSLVWNSSTANHAIQLLSLARVYIYVVRQLHNQYTRATVFELLFTLVNMWLLQAAIKSLFNTQWAQLNTFGCNETLYEWLRIAGEEGTEQRFNLVRPSTATSLWILVKISHVSVWTYNYKSTLVWILHKSLRKNTMTKENPRVK